MSNMNLAITLQRLEDLKARRDQKIDLFATAASAVDSAKDDLNNSKHINKELPIEWRFSISADKERLRIAQEASDLAYKEEMKAEEELRQALRQCTPEIFASWKAKYPFHEWERLRDGSKK